MSLELKWFIYVLIQHEIVTPEFALTLLARLGQENTSLEEYAQQLFELLSDGLPEPRQSQVMQQIQSFVEYAIEHSEPGEEPPEIYELEIVDDFAEEDGTSAAADTEFDPFAGLGATPGMVPPAETPPPAAAQYQDDDFEDDNSTAIMEAPAGEDAEAPATQFRTPRPAPQPDTPLDERVLSGPVGEIAEEDGPSVEDIMAAFNRKHGGTGKIKTPPVQTAPPAARTALSATETTRSLKKVKVEAKVFSEPAKAPTAVDTVPLSLPHFFPDTGKRTLKIDNMPSLDNIESLNSGECAMVMMDMVAALRRHQASDLYINAGEPVFIRRFGLISHLDTPALSQKAAEQLNFSLLDSDQKQEFLKKRRLGFSLVLRDGRCRCNLRDQLHGISGSFHLAPSYIRQLNELGFLPEHEKDIHRILENPSGLIVVAGPAGGGKTTTLAAMVDYMAHRHFSQVVMIENPIEIIQDSAVGNIIQRETGRHTSSMGVALRAATREDCNAVVLSEIYNPDTIEQALRATEDGILVIVSMYATSTAAVLARLMEVFEPIRRPDVRAMISGNLRGIIVQKLIRSAEPDSQTVIYELMTNTPETAALLVDGRIADVTALMRKGKQPGMCTFDSCVVDKYHAGQVTGEAAQQAIHHPDIRAKVEQEVALAESKKLLSERRKQK